MSNTSEKTAIANIAFLSVGVSTIGDIGADTVNAKKVSGIFENVVKELLGSDWFFNRRRTKLEDLTPVYKLTVDTAPTPAVFPIGATLTGATSGVTCTVKARLSDTVYLVTEPSGDWTDGETINDGTNSVDCATDYPEEDEIIAHGTYDYGYVIPSDKLFIRGVGDLYFDKIKYDYGLEGDILLTNVTDAYFHYNRWIGENESETVSDVTVMPIWFHRLISAKIAYLLSPNITKDQRREPKVEKEWREAYLDAKEQNGESVYHEHEQKGNLDWAEGAHNELGAIL
jgi:hypothetical protein